MGLFSFGKKVKLYAPVDGTIKNLATDAETGFIVEPERHHVYSPVAGTVKALRPDQQIIELQSGKLTVHLQLGNPAAGTASTYVHEGDQVTPETPLAFVDEDPETATVKVVMNPANGRVKNLKLSTSGQVSHDQEVGSVIAK